MTVDEIVKLASIAGAIIVGAAAAYTYWDTANRDLEKPFNDVQLTLCRDAAETAATLASAAPRKISTPLLQTEKLEDSWELARIRFEQLYWGSLAIVENDEVEGTMVAFRKMLVPHDERIRAGTLSAESRESLQQAALKISHACRKLVSKTWKLRLPDLTGKP